MEIAKLKMEDNSSLITYNGYVCNRADFQILVIFFSPPFQPRLQMSGELILNR